MTPVCKIVKVAYSCHNANDQKTEMLMGKKLLAMKYVNLTMAF